MKSNMKLHSSARFGRSIIFVLLVCISNVCFGQVNPMKSPLTTTERQAYLQYIKSNLNSDDISLYIQRYIEEDVLIAKENENWDPVLTTIGDFKKMATKVSDSLAVIVYLDSLDAIINREEKPINLSILNKKTVNSKKDEYAPCLSLDGKTLYFTRGDKGNILTGEDIYVSQWDVSEKKWGRANKIGSPVNTEGENESIISISSDQQQMLLYKTDPKGAKGDIYITTINPKTNWWQKPAPLSKAINSPDWEGSGFLSADGRYLLFTSSKRNSSGPYAPKGTTYHGDTWGNTDIYLAEWVNGGWSEPIPLNNNINTPFAEMSPYLSADGMTLYFSSDGHPGFGRLDVFMSKRENPSDWNSWGEPKNLGKYVNSPWNDWDYIFPNNSDKAFFAQERDVTGWFGGGAKQFDIVVSNLRGIVPSPCTEEIKIPVEEHERFMDQGPAQSKKPVEVELVDPETRERIAKTTALPGDTAKFFISCSQPYEVLVTSDHIPVNKVPPVPPRTTPGSRPKAEQERIEQANKRKKAEEERQQELDDDIEDLEEEAEEQIAEQREEVEQEEEQELKQKEEKIEREAQEELEKEKEAAREDAQERLAEQKKQAEESFDESMPEAAKENVLDALEKQSEEELAQKLSEVERESEKEKESTLSEVRKETEERIQEKVKEIEREVQETLKEKKERVEEKYREEIAEDSWEGPEEYVDPARTKQNETRKTVGPRASSPVEPNVFIKNPYEVDDPQVWEQLDEEARELAPDLEAVDSMLSAFDPSDTLLLDWPVRSVKELDPKFPSDALPDTAFWVVSAYFDHDARAPGYLRDWNNGSITYDLADGYSHAGTDIMAFPFSWERFSNNEIEIVAAADGVIISIVDGESDKNCQINRSVRGNSVGIMHGNGTTTWYGHLTTGSTGHNKVGQSVKSGQYLGLMGSSGASTGPHLHFAMLTPDRKDIDPYKGPGSSSKRSMWRKQKPYRNPAISAIFTHAYIPQIRSCGVPEKTHKSSEFSPGDEVVVGVYFRDLIKDDVIHYTMLNPAGELVSSGEHLNESTLSLGSVFWKYGLPRRAQSGVWKIQVQYRDKMHLAYFNVTGEEDWKETLPPIAETEATGPKQVVHKPIVVIDSEKLDRPLKGDKICFETWAIKFAFNSAELTRIDKFMIDGFYDDIMNYPGRVIEITGHTDPVGSAAYNKILGQRRADAIKAYFIEKGTDPIFIKTRSKGEEEPLFFNGVINNEMSRRVGICILN